MSEYGGVSQIYLLRKISCGEISGYRGVTSNVYVGCIHLIFVEKKFLILEKFQDMEVSDRVSIEGERRDLKDVLVCKVTSS